MRNLAVLFAVVAPLALPSLAGARSWPEWGNDEIADCTFAMAADWEMADLDYTPNEAQVRRQYYEAGGTAENGLAQGLSDRWWLRHGIGGVHVRMREVPGEDSLFTPTAELLPAAADARLERLLGLDHYLIAYMGWWSHEIMLTGYTTTGPTYITYGEERQMTWLEWRAGSWGLYVPSVVR